MGSAGSAATLDRGGRVRWAVGASQGFWKSVWGYVPRMRTKVGFCAVLRARGLALRGVVMRFMRARGGCDREGEAWAEFWSSFGGHNPEHPSSRPKTRASTPLRPPKITPSSNLPLNHEPIMMCAQESQISECAFAAQCDGLDMIDLKKPPCRAAPEEFGSFYSYVRFALPASPAPDLTFEVRRNESRVLLRRSCWANRLRD